MKSLPAFSIKSWDKTEQVFSMVAWREREQAILLLDAAGSPKILRPLLPQLDQKGWHYIRNPYPDAQPLRMEAIRLLCPPCRGNAQEAAKINAPVDPTPFTSDYVPYSACEWEKAWVQCGDEVLWPKPDDASLLRALVEQFTARKQGEYEARKQKLSRLTVGEFRCLQITKQVDGLCAVLPADSDTLRRYVREESFRLDCEINQSLSETTIGHGDASFLTPRLRIAQEYSELVCSYLRENWARKHSLDLAAMEQERLRFIEFVRKHATNVMESVPPAFDRRDLFSGQKRESTAQRPGLQLAPQEELVLCAQVRYVLIFSDGSRVWLAACKPRPPHASEEHDFDACLGVGEAARLEVLVPILAAERQKLEAAPGQLAVQSQRIEAATDQLTAKTTALDEVISPLNRLYLEVELAQIRKRAFGKGVPDLFADWALMQFQRSSPGRLPTKGDAFNTCGPGTVIGKKLEQAGFGISKQRFADHLTVIRRLLEEKGWLASRGPGKSRKRESHVQPNEHFEDINQPSPAESAEDRDEERQASVLDIRDSEAKEASGDPNERSDAD